MAEPFPWKDVGGGTPEQKARWYRELEKAGMAKVQAMLSPGTGGDLALGGPGEVPRAWAQAWLDHRLREAEKANRVALEERMLAATIAAARAAEATSAAAKAAARRRQGSDDRGLGGCDR